MSLEIRFRPFMDALYVRNLPKGENWSFEIKFDGYRCQATKQRGDVHVYSRNGNDFNEKFPVIVEAIEALHAREFTALFGCSTDG